MAIGPLTLYLTQILNTRLHVDNFIDYMRTPLNTRVRYALQTEPPKRATDML